MRDGKTIKIKYFMFSLLLIAICFTSSCSKPQQDIQIYSFSGANDLIEINNGLIISTNDQEKFIGGDLSFIGDEPSDVKHYIVKFLDYKDKTSEMGC